jgi:hypothetical protein
MLRGEAVESTYPPLDLEATQAREEILRFMEAGRCDQGEAMLNRTAAAAAVTWH